MAHKKLFWLHVKKSAGITTRSLLQPYYTEVDRVKKPKCFIQASPEEYNDILNNYRVVLGEYQFRRCLFAKKYLYPDSWDELLSFAFSREPTERCLSMFFYLYAQKKSKGGGLSKVLNYFGLSRGIRSTTSNEFDAFLDFIEIARESDSIYQPIDNHFTTHTAPMFDDISDHEGNILIKRVFRLECLREGINSVFEECGIDKRLDCGVEETLNRTANKADYSINREQRKKIEKIYSNDYEIYESAIKL